MLAIAGQTAGPNGQTFLWEPMGTLRITKAKKIDFLKIRFSTILQDSGHLS